MTTSLSRSSATATVMPLTKRYPDGMWRISRAGFQSSRRRSTEATACEPETDGHVARFEARLGKLSKAKPPVKIR